MQNGDTVQVRTDSASPDTVEATVLDVALFAPSVLVRVDGETVPVLIDPDTVEPVGEG